MSIRVLSPNLINQIAAGEVIERPASVLKELVENALDAGASTIEVNLVGGGKNLLCVTDNGKAMSKEDLLLAVERHATSKLPDDNLFNINFFGFRGEALPSIGSVARLNIVSRTKDEENAWEISVNGGEKSAVEPTAGNFGTRVEVRDLFYMTPARLKFMKTDAAETAQCIDMLQRIAMANPHVAFYLYADGKKKVSLPQTSNDLLDCNLQRLTDILGKDFSQNSIAISAENNFCRISGYVGLPTYDKANSLSEFLFVNNRPVRDKLILGAIKGAYQDLIVSGRYPICAIFITVDPMYVDVNVHPTKSEVRFYDNTSVRALLVKAIRSALEIGSKQSAQTQSLEHLLQDALPKEQFMSSSFASSKTGSAFAAENSRTFRTYTPSGGFARTKSDIIPNLSRAYSVYAPQEAPESDYQQIGELGLAKAQFHNTYIISQSEDSIIIIDQHAAHERITLEKMKQNMQENKTLPSQMLLIPEVVDLNAEECAALLEQADTLKKLGMHIEAFGTNAVIVSEIPALLGDVDIKKLILNLAQETTEWGEQYSLSDKIHHICATIACHGSIRAGRTLKIEEMNALLREMEKTINSGQCNHGRPTYVKIKLEDIEKLFERR